MSETIANRLDALWDYIDGECPLLSGLQAEVAGLESALATERAAREAERAEHWEAVESLRAERRDLKERLARESEEHGRTLHTLSALRSRVEGLEAGIKRALQYGLDAVSIDTGRTVRDELRELRAEPGREGDQA